MNKFNNELSAVIRDYNTFVSHRLTIVLNQFPRSQRHLSVTLIHSKAMEIKIKLGRALRWEKKEYKINNARAAIDILFDLLEILDYARLCGFLGLISTEPNNKFKNRIASDSEMLYLSDARRLASDERYEKLSFEITSIINKLKELSLC